MNINNSIALSIGLLTSVSLSACGDNGNQTLPEATGGTVDDEDGTGGKEGDGSGGSGSGGKNDLGGASGESEPDPEATGGGNAVDPNAPTIVSSSPENGAKGVDVDLEFEVVFSEPMNTDSVEAAINSYWAEADIEWNAAKTVMTCRPAANLEYGLEETPKDYSFVIKAGAEDAQGDELASDFALNFRTLTVYERMLAPTELSGHFDSKSEFVAGAFLAGDGTTNQRYDIWLSFDHAEIPESASIVVARLFTVQTAMVGTPYKELVNNDSGLRLWSIKFDEIGTFTDPSLIGNLCMSIETPECSLDVSGAFMANWKAGTNSQYRLDFAIATNGDEKNDNLQLKKTETRLGVGYLAE